MSLFRRAVAERRSAPTLFDAALRVGGASGATRAGLVSGAESERLMAVWRCQQMLTDITAGLPVEVFTRRSGRQVRVDEALFVSDPSSTVDAVEWRGQMVLSALAHGNGLAIITDLLPSGWPRRAETVPWSMVRVRQERLMGPVEYLVDGRVVDADRVIHLRAFGPRAGEVCGVSPITAARESIRLGLAVRGFGQNWYDSGGHPTTVLSTDQGITATQAREAKDALRAATMDDHVAAIGNGWKLQSVQVAPDDALFLAASNATAVDICGYYGVPASFLGFAPGGSSVTYANQEQRSIELLVYTLQWWFGRLERLLGRQLPAGQFCRINADALLRTDAATRWRIHDLAVRLGARSIDEVRRFEDEGPLQNGAGSRFLWPPNAAQTAPNPDADKE